MTIILKSLLILLFLNQYCAAQKEERHSYEGIGFLFEGKTEYELEKLNSELIIFTGIKGNELYINIESMDSYHFTIVGEIGKNFIDGAMYYDFIAITSDDVACKFRFFPNEAHGLYFSFKDGFTVQLYNELNQSKKQNNTFEVMTDNRNEKTYKTIKIGTQVWMAENLAYETESGNYWHYDNKSSNGTQYGYIYDWKTACNACPSGWRLPSNNDWMNLIDYLGNTATTGYLMKNEFGWSNSGNGNNYSGFSALPGGIKYTNDDFNNIGYLGTWWSSSSGGVKFGWLVKLFASKNEVLFEKHEETIGSYVRCIKNN